VEQVEAGACGLKVHEDWGATPAVIDCSLSVADDFDVQLAIHTDSLNESGFVEDTVSAIDGRTIHTFHTEGAGGGHAPDIMAVAGYPNVLPASTNPTRPYTVNTIAEHLYMLMVCHHLNPAVPTDKAFAESRIRAETIAAEDWLHDRGVLSMYSSDSQAMGRIGEVFLRAFQTASKMKDEVAQLPEDAADNDNFRVLRYLAKLTINPAITHGVADLIGSLEVGKLADIVLWPMSMFAAKPAMVIKGGMINWAVMGDPNGAVWTPEPVCYRPMFSARGPALARTCVTFLSQAGIERGVPDRLGLRRMIHPVSKCRALTKRAMVRNDTLAEIRVDPHTNEVTVNGELATSKPASWLPLTQAYFMV
jgi:urease subunit alpha